MSQHSEVTVPAVKLHDGKLMPQLGYGVWQVEDSIAASCVQRAIEAGYRSIDTATIYENEAGVGKAVRASGIDRDELFITTKLWNSSHAYDDALQAMDESLDRLGLDAVDLYLIHWPAPVTGNFHEAWRALVQLKADGRARSIGVANFAIDHLEQLAQNFDEQPVVNQIELHPYFQQDDLRAYCAAHAIAVEAWSPLGQGGDLLADPILAAIAERHGRTTAQVVVRWHLQLANIVIPKSVTPSRITENIDVFTFELSDEELAQIKTLDRVDGRIGPVPSLATF